MKTLVAIPVYNESRYLPGVLRAVAQYTDDLLIIDDGSSDGSERILADWPGIEVIRHPENRGYGQSLIDAFGFAAERGYDWVITLDCDEQHEPERIPDFVAAARAATADVISGSRYLRCFPGDDAPPRERRRINETVTDLLDQLLGLRLTDSFCGFKAHRVSAMQKLTLDEPGYAFPLQFWVECARANLQIHEIPVRRIYRDRSREFGGTLDDPAARLHHYLEVLMRELGRESTLPQALPVSSAICQCRTA